METEQAGAISSGLPARFTMSVCVIMPRIMHNASQESKCLLHHGLHYANRMDNAHDRLKAARIAAGYPTAKEAAEAMGIPVATYVQHENGSRGYPVARAQRYARFFKTTPEWLLYGRRNGGNTEFIELGPRIAVQGAVVAGVYKKRMEYEEADWEYFVGSPTSKEPPAQRFGLRVDGDSMDVLYPPGTIIECLRYWGDREIESGKRVVVQRYNEAGEIETTVKEYRVSEDGVEWLIPRSNNPAYQAFRADEVTEGVTRIEIVAIVISSIRPE